MTLWLQNVRNNYDMGDKKQNQKRVVNSIEMNENVEWFYTIIFTDVWHENMYNTFVENKSVRDG